MSFVGKVCSRKILCIPWPANDDYDVDVVGVDVGVGVDVDDVGVGVDVDDVGVDVQRLQERFLESKSDAWMRFCCCP